MDANGCPAGTLDGPAVITVQQLIEVTPVAINDVNTTNQDTPVAGNVITTIMIPKAYHSWLRW